MLAQGLRQLAAHPHRPQPWPPRLAEADQGPQPVLLREHPAQFSRVAAQSAELGFACLQAGFDQFGLAAETLAFLVESLLLRR